MPFKDTMIASERANHSRWCLNNPLRESYVKKNNGSQLRTPEAIEKRVASIKKAHVDGKYDGAITKGVATKRKNGKLTHTEETKKLLSEKALASKHRRLIRSVRNYVKKDGTIVMLDSSWEEHLAIRLDELGVNWIRPETPIPYITHDGKTHNYFPDFYLPDFDLYLDPKNPAAVNTQKEKLDILKKTLYNLVILTSLQECKCYKPI